MNNSLSSALKKKMTGTAGQPLAQPVQIQLGQSHSGPCKQCRMNVFRAGHGDSFTKPPCHKNCKCNISGSSKGRALQGRMA